MNGLRRLLPRGYRLADWLMAWVSPLCLLWLLEGFSRGSVGSVPAWAVSQPLLFGMNYALYAAPCLLMCLIPSRRARLCGLLALGLLCALLGIVNRYKIFYRMEPLLFSDVTQLADARQAAAGLSLDIDYVEIIIVAAVFAALFAAAGIGMRGRSRCGALVPLLGAVLIAVLPPLSTMIAHILSKNLAAFGERRGNLQSRGRRHGGRVASGAAKSGKRNAPPFSLCTNRRSAAHGKKFCRLKTFFVNYCNNQNARPKTTLFGKRTQFAENIRLNRER